MKKKFHISFKTIVPAVEYYGLFAMRTAELLTSFFGINVNFKGWTISLAFGSKVFMCQIGFKYSFSEQNKTEGVSHGQGQ